MKKSKVLLDMMLNIVAVAIPVAVLQFIVYPKTAQILNSEFYGLMITTYSVWSVISNTIGNALNNVRLLNNGEYEEKQIEGDFNVILQTWNIVNCVVSIGIIVILTKEHSIINIFLDMIIAILFVLKAYLEVDFRIKLNYVNVLVSNSLQAIGFLLGCFILVKTGMWQMIFLLGYLFSTIFCVIKTSLIKEKKEKTELYGVVKKDFTSITSASILTNMMNYADKLVLYPLMGGTAVSIYYTATILGKVVSMFTGPINSVVLSYISRWDSSRKNIMKYILLAATGIAVLGYVVTLLVSRPVLTLLYPQWIKEVINYIPITTVTIMLTTIDAIICPFVLKFCKRQWQVLFSFVGLITYFVAALLLWKGYGLMGFCIGSIIGELSRLTTMLIVYYKN